MNKNKFVGICKVGEKGQIVIPKEIRNMFDINPGDSIIVLSDKEKVAEAKCCLFEAVIEEAIRAEFAKLKEKRTGFEYLENDEIII